jgi:hypothetical protein
VENLVQLNQMSLVKAQIGRSTRRCRLTQLASAALPIRLGGVDGARFNNTIGLFLVGPIDGLW